MLVFDTVDMHCFSLEKIYFENIKVNYLYYYLKKPLYFSQKNLRIDDGVLS